MKQLLVLLPIAVLLGGCPGRDETAQVSLPPVPTDIKTCFREAGIVVPHKDLTQAEIESLWKNDRLRLKVQNKCGKRFLTWYEDLRSKWK